MVYPINRTVEAMGSIKFDGNIIPNEWYNHLKNINGKVQTNALLILADLVYWYRPVPIYDIKTGQLNRYGKKFKEDLLQRSYKNLEEKFGLSKNQIRDALIFLEEKNLVFREFRDIKIGNHIINTVMYLGIKPEKILEISGSNNTSVKKQIKECPKAVNCSDTPVDTSISEKPSITDLSNEVGDFKTNSSPTLFLSPDWSSTFTEKEKEFFLPFASNKTQHRQSN